MKHKEGKDIIPIFIKSVVFQHVVSHSLIQPTGKKAKIPHWIELGPWHNKTICHNLCGSIFEYFFVTARQDIYDIVCAVNAYINQLNGFKLC